MKEAAYKAMGSWVKFPQLVVQNDEQSGSLFITFSLQWV